MIESFADRATEDLFHGINSSRVRRIPNQIREASLYKLDVLNGARSLEDLRTLPGNRLERLRGNFAGKYSIRINAQWRIVFGWRDSAAHDVEIIDYH